MNLAVGFLWVTIARGILHNFPVSSRLYSTLYTYCVNYNIMHNIVRKYFRLATARQTSHEMWAFNLLFFNSYVWIHEYNIIYDLCKALIHKRMQTKPLHQSLSKKKKQFIKIKKVICYSSFSHIVPYLYLPINWSCNEHILGKIELICSGRNYDWTLFIGPNVCNVANKIYDWILSIVWYLAW